MARRGGGTGGGPVAGAAGELAARASAFSRSQRVAGLVAGVVHGDELAWSAASGAADLASGRPAGPATLYRIASVTKTFTGTAVLQLAEAGRLHLDDPAVAHLPELREAANPFGSIEALTIRRMLSHESGLAADPPGTEWSELRYEGDPARTLARAAEIAITVPPHAQHKYSNLAYQLLAEIVARASRLPFDRYLDEAVLSPLGMDSTAFEPLAAPLAARRAAGYAAVPYSDALAPAATIPPVWGEGGLSSTLEDLARWISFQLRAHVPGGAAPAAVLPAATVREMQAPRYLVDDAWTRAAGISWLATRREDTVWIQHSGWIHGFASSVCFDPRSQVGAVVLTNTSAEVAELAIDLAAIARHAAGGGAGDAPATAVPDAYRSLLGLYLRPDVGATMRVEWRGGRLALSDPAFPGWNPVLAPGGAADAFVVEPGCDQSGEQVRFLRLADGRVAAVTFAAATSWRLDPVAGDLLGDTTTDH